MHSIDRILLKGGVGTGRYSLDDSKLVDDQLAGMVGVELTPSGRDDFGTFVDAYLTKSGSAYRQNDVPVHYRLRAVRIGSMIRFHLHH
ncbi:MAG: hypothetical protein U0132_17225 [Gemmatimonadaceae bacterium]